MYAIMYLNVDVFDHIYLAPTRTYMTFLMIAPMAFTMLLFMWGMYKKKGWNYAILGRSSSYVRTLLRWSPSTDFCERRAMDEGDDSTPQFGHYGESERLT